MPWTPLARARQAALIRERKPWLKSTGPRTAAGKARSSRNAHKGGWRRHIRELATLLRQLKKGSATLALNSFASFARLISPRLPLCAFVPVASMPPPPAPSSP